MAPETADAVVPEAPVVERVNGAGAEIEDTSDTSEAQATITAKSGHRVVLRSRQHVSRQMGAEFREPPEFLIQIEGRRGGLGIQVVLDAEQVDDLQASLRFSLKGRGMQPNG